MQEHFTRWLAYNRWANQTLAEVLETQNLAEEESCLRWFSHLLTAEQVWYRRMVLEPPPSAPLWALRPLATLKEEIETNHSHLATLIAKTVDYDQFIHYQNTRGDNFQTPMKEILGHLFNHGTHHRGQILARIRELGKTPQSLDFIFFTRMHP